MLLVLAGIMITVIGSTPDILAHDSPILEPSPVSTVFDGSGGFSALDGARGVAVFESGSRTYAIVTAWAEGGVQIMDITNPVHPAPVSAVFDGSGGFSALDVAIDVAVFESGSRTYAIVAAWDDDGVQIMDITPSLSNYPLVETPLSHAIYDAATARLLLAFSEPVTVLGQSNLSLVHDIAAHDESGTSIALTGADLLTIDGLSRSDFLVFVLNNQAHTAILETINSGGDVHLAIGPRAIYTADGFIDIATVGGRQPPILMGIEIVQ